MKSTATGSDEEARHTPQEIDAFDLLLIAQRHLRTVVLGPIAISVAVGIASFALPNIFTATAKILPPQQSSSALTAILMGDTSALSSGGAVGQALGLKNPSDIYVGMLQSRTIADTLIAKFDLQKLYGEETLVATRKELADASNIYSSRDGIITIDVDDTDPQRAAMMANAYVQALDDLTQNVSVTAAGRQRVFLAKQLEQAKAQLGNVELALKEIQEKTGLISVIDQGRAMIESAVSLRALVAAKQVQLASLGSSSTDRNPEFVRAARELAELRAELARIEKKSTPSESGVIPSAGAIPDAALQYMRGLRDVQYQQTLLELLAKQYEIARAQEAAEGGIIQTLDRAVVPDKKSKPRRLLIVVLAAVISTFACFAFALFSERRERLGKEPLSFRMLMDFLKKLLPGRARGTA